MILIVFSSDHTQQLEYLLIYYIIGIMTVSAFSVSSFTVGNLYLRAMRDFQRYEFDRHKWRVRFTTIVIVMCLFNLAEQLGFRTQLVACLREMRVWGLSDVQQSLYCQQMFHYDTLYSTQ